MLPVHLLVNYLHILLRQSGISSRNRYYVFMFRKLFFTSLVLIAILHCFQKLVCVVCRHVGNVPLFNNYVLVFQLQVLCDSKLARFILVKYFLVSLNLKSRITMFVLAISENTQPISMKFCEYTQVMFSLEKQHSSFLGGLLLGIVYKFSNPRSVLILQIYDFSSN